MLYWELVEKRGQTAFSAGSPCAGTSVYVGGKGVSPHFSTSYFTAIVDGGPVWPAMLKTTGT